MSSTYGSLQNQGFDVATLEQAALSARYGQSGWPLRSSQMFGTSGTSAYSNTQAYMPLAAMATYGSASYAYPMSYQQQYVQPTYYETSYAAATGFAYGGVPLNNTIFSAPVAQMARPQLQYAQAAPMQNYVQYAQATPAVTNQVYYTETAPARYSLTSGVAPVRYSYTRGDAIRYNYESPHVTTAIATAPARYSYTRGNAVRYSYESPLPTTTVAAVAPVPQVIPSYTAPAPVATNNFAPAQWTPSYAVPSRTSVAPLRASYTNNVQVETPRAVMYAGSPSTPKNATIITTNDIGTTVGYQANTLAIPAKGLAPGILSKQPSGFESMIMSQAF